MKLAQGVNLHFIQSTKFKTNKIKIRFSAPMSADTIAERVIVSSLLETANAVYPTSQLFREHLASLYGSNYSTSVSRRGLIHYVDVNVSFVRDSFLSRKNALTTKIIEFIKASLLSPLAHDGAFDSSIFDIEKKNLIHELESEVENHFYHAHLELNQLFYISREMQIPRVSTVELMRQVTSETSFSVFQKMLKEDQIDIFFIGDFNELAMQEQFELFKFSDRKQILSLNYQQNFSKILREGIEQKEAHQSILEMGYHFPIQYGEDSHIPLLVLNSLLGGYAHSKLFVEVREKASLAYTVSSSMDIFSGMLRVYAGIDRQNRNKAMTLINRQVTDLKRGNFSEEELQQTKKMLRNSALLSQDRQNSLLEMAYLSSILGEKFLAIDEWLIALENVQKEDVVSAANNLKLQAMYFMEGK